MIFLNVCLMRFVFTSNNRTGFLHATQNGWRIFDTISASTILQSGKCLQIGKSMVYSRHYRCQLWSEINSDSSFIRNSCADTTSSVTTIPICTLTWIHFHWLDWAKMTSLLWHHTAISSVVAWWFIKSAIGARRKFPSTTFSVRRWSYSRWVHWNRKHK